ncbi:MAG: hypothetical protein WCZ18_09095 [Ottowia sp.]|nr:hypothetical protein [Ottowia sp.]
MKSERITFLATPEFKDTLRQAAAREQISVGALIRARFDPAANADASSGAEAQELRQLTKELRDALREARAALQDGLAQAEHSLRELRQGDRGDSDERQVA